MRTATPWTVFDREELLDAISIARANGQREALIAVDGLHCASCATRLQKTLAGIARDIRVNLTAKTVEFRWLPDQQALSVILQALDQAGFQPVVLGQDAKLQSASTEQRAALQRIGIAAICAMQVMMLAWPAYSHTSEIGIAVQDLMRYAQWILATPALIYSGWPFFSGAATALSQRAVNMDVPVALALTVAYAVSAWRTAAGHQEIYFDTVTMFVLLLAGGRYLESRTRSLATERLRVLAGRRALTATRLANGKRELVPISALAAGDEILVVAGEAVPVDGELLYASAELDESLLTGESSAVAHGPGARLLAGSINVGPAALTLRTQAADAESMLSQITRLLNRAQSERPGFQALSDRISGGFIAGVLALAAIAAIFWWPQGMDRSLSAALAVLVASCPCALALAVPAVFAAASSRLIGDGVLLARPQALARLPKVDIVLFDKTGTLTRSEFQIRTVIPLGQRPQKECLEIAAALEADSTHPIAKAFAGLAGAVCAQNLHLQAGQGVCGHVEGMALRLGSPEQAAASIARPLREAQAIHGDHLTWLALETAGEALALIGLSAEERPEAAEVAAQLHAAGLRLELLTGDSAAAAEHAARHLGLDAFRARCKPEDKLAYLQKLQKAGHVVMVVGDGINDAPFLGAADVAVSMPLGAALAQSQADAVLTGDNLRGLPAMLDVSRRVHRLTRQNLAWAIGYNLTVLPLAMAGVLTPWVAALGMSASSLLVVANALRVAPNGRDALKPHKPIAPEARTWKVFSS